MSASIPYPRTLHVDGSGIVGSTSSRPRLNWADIADRNVVLEEKMDGSETSFEFDADAEPRLHFRQSPLSLSSRGGAERPFDGLKDWFALHQDVLFDVIDTRYRVYGEWLFAAHRIFYDALPDYFLEFDILDKESGLFLDTPSRRRVLEELDHVHSVRVMFAGAASLSPHPSKLDLRSAFRTEANVTAAGRACARIIGRGVGTAGRFDTTCLMEGIYGKIEENGSVVQRFKWVRPEFVESIVTCGQHWRNMPLVPNDRLEGFSV